MHWIWVHTVRPAVSVLPRNLRVPTAALLTIAFILFGASASEKGQDKLRDYRAVSLFRLAVYDFPTLANIKQQKAVRCHHGDSGNALCNLS
jgi:concentrative nucleoside transporter, CNT family